MLKWCTAFLCHAWNFSFEMSDGCTNHSRLCWRWNIWARISWLVAIESHLLESTFSPVRIIFINLQKLRSYIAEVSSCMFSRVKLSHKLAITCFYIILINFKNIYFYRIGYIVLIPPVMWTTTRYFDVSLQVVLLLRNTFPTGVVSLCSKVLKNKINKI